jgi:hypothetical protein
MYVIYGALKTTGGKTDGETLVNAAKGMKWESPRGPMAIDPATRDVIQTVYIRLTPCAINTLWASLSVFLASRHLAYDGQEFAPDVGWLHWHNYVSGEALIFGLKCRRAWPRRENAPLGGSTRTARQHTATSRRARPRWRRSPRVGGGNS